MDLFDEFARESEFHTAHKNEERIIISAEEQTVACLVPFQDIFHRAQRLADEAGLRTHGCTDQSCKREESSCQLGAVHTWHEAADPECPLSCRLAGAKRTTFAPSERFRF
jgi:hypothetical protein